MSRDLPPYQRMVDDVRRRIDKGELRPGDRLPSTRRLAKKWGVSLSTASKALRTLVQVGAIVALPRVGTVVAARRAARDAAREPELGRERIVREAIAMADGGGLPALSLRGLATRMGVPVMSLYRHVPGKEELLGAMTEVVLSEATLPAPAPAHWRARLEAAARTSWSVYRRHPWMARVITILRPLPLPASIVHADWIFEGLERAGVDAATILRIHVTVYAYVQGLAVNLEAEAEAQGETGIDDQTWMASKGSAYEALAKSGRFPAFARVTGELQEGFDLPIDDVFEFGLRTLLDGFERIVA